MPKNLVIVESPAKAKTIGKFLGDEYVVKSSVGHIRDLPRKEMGVDVKKGFEPIYIIDPEKKHVVSELKKRQIFREDFIDRVNVCLGGCLNNIRARSMGDDDSPFHLNFNRDFTESIFPASHRTNGVI